MELRPRPPFRLDLTAWALRRQPHNAIDRWDGRTWRRVLAVGSTAVELQVEQRGPADAAVLDVELGGIGPGDHGADEAARATATRILGLDADLSGFHRMAAAEPRLAPLEERYRGMHPQRFPELFEALANAVACQQVSLNAGIALLGRLATRYGRALPDDAGAHAFPRARDLLLADPAELRQDGWSRQKSSYLLDIAAALTDESWCRRLEAATDDDAFAELVRLRGVGSLERAIRAASRPRALERLPGGRCRRPKVPRPVAATARCARRADHRRHRVALAAIRRPGPFPPAAVAAGARRGNRRTPGRSGNGHRRERRVNACGAGRLRGVAPSTLSACGFPPAGSRRGWLPW